MTLRHACVLSLSLLGCTPVRPTAPPAEPAAQPVAPVVAAKQAEPATPVAAPVTCKYKAEPPSLLPEIVAPDSGACRKPPAKVKSELAAQIDKKWMRTWPKGKLEIADGCDRLDEQIDSLVFESSGGHGGSLTLGSLDRRADGDYDLMLLEYNHYNRDRSNDGKDPYKEDSAGTLAISRGLLKAATMKPLLERTRAAAYVEIVEREPPPTPGRIYGVGGSSRNYHFEVRLIDHNGRGVQRYFAGYASGGEEQKDGVPMSIVQSSMATTLADATLRAGFTPSDTSDPAARALFARLFWHARARGEDYGFWYVRERLLGMAASLGSDQHVPALLTHLQPGKKEASVARSNVLAINAIAALTGHDSRHAADGAPREVDEVSAETLAACSAPVK